MPECQQDHGLIPVRPTGVFTPLDQPLDLWLGQVLAGAHVGVPGAARGFDFPYLGVWRHDFQGWFRHVNQCSCRNDFQQSGSNTESLQWLFIGQSSIEGGKKGPGDDWGQAKTGSRGACNLVCQATERKASG